STLKYQWRFQGTNLVSAGNVSGATSSALKLTSVQAAQAGAYSVVIINSAGSVISADAILTVLTPPVLLTQPQTQSVGAGGNSVFNVAVGGSTPLSYQWRFNGTNLANGGSINGAATSSLVLSNLQAAQAGSYSIFVSNALGSVTSSNALLTVLAPPSITTQPGSQTVAEGVTMTLSAAAAGSG